MESGNKVNETEFLLTVIYSSYESLCKQFYQYWSLKSTELIKAY